MTLPTNKQKHAVMLKIKELTETDIPTSFPNLCHYLYPDLKEDDVFNTIDWLENEGFIHGEYGGIGYGWAGRLYYVEETAPKIYHPKTDSDLKVKKCKIIIQTNK